MSDWRPRVEAMIAGQQAAPPPASPTEVDDWITPAEPMAAAAPAMPEVDDWITPDEPAPSFMDSVNAAPGRVLESAMRGGVQGFREGGVINLSREEQARAVQEWGPIAYPIATLGAGVDLAARAGAGLFRGAQAGVQQLFDEFGNPQLGRDVAAMPEAFMGGPSIPAPPRAAPVARGPSGPGTLRLTGPDSPMPSGPAPGSPPGSPGAPRPAGPLPTTWGEVLQQTNEGTPPPAAPRPVEPAPTAPAAPSAAPRPQQQSPVMVAEPVAPPVSPVAALDAMMPAAERRQTYPHVPDAELAVVLDQAVKETMQKAPPGTPGMTPDAFMARVRQVFEGLMLPINTAATIAARKTSLGNMLNDPRPNEEIAAEIAAQQTGAVDDARSRLPEGFTIQEQPGGEWTLFDPAGDPVGSVLDVPTQADLDKWITDAEGLAQDVDWSDALRDGDGTKASPINVVQPNDLAAVAPLIAKPPTPDQAAAGNYQKVHAKLHGLDIAIETPAGGERHGIDPDGKPWTTVMPGDYGEIKRSKGADGDPVDVYLGPSAHEANQHPVWIVDQIDPKTGQFDEHKAMIGYPTRQAAETAYRAGFSNGSGQSRMGAVSDMGWPQFIRWARRGNTTDPLRYQPPATQPAGTPEPVSDMPGPAPTDMGIPASVDAPAGPAPVPPEPEPEPIQQLMVEAELLEMDLAAQGTPGSNDAWDQVQIPVTIEEEQDGGSTRSGGDGDNGGQAPADASEPPTRPETTAEGAGQEPGGEAGDGGGQRPPVARPRPADNQGRPTVTTEPDRGPRRDPEPSAPSPSPSVQGPGEQGRPAVETVEAPGAGVGKPPAPQPALAPPAPATPPRLEWTRIGTNFYDNPLFEDGRGVRSYTEDGIRVTEPVSINPAGGITVRERSPEYMTQEELENAGPTVYGDSPETLEAVAPEDGGGDAPVGDAGSGSAGGEQGSSTAGVGTDAGGDATVRGGGDGSTGTDLPDAGTGTGVAPKAPRPKKEKAAAKQKAAKPPPEPDAAPPLEDASSGNIPAIDFVIDDSLELGKGSEGEKYRDNVAAIKTLKKIEDENRRATPDEQRVLARYVGWGGLKNAFRVAGSGEGEGVAKGWEKRVAELEELLTAPELRAARASTRAAHYTSQAVVEAIWSGVQRLGFTGGAVLEPSVGTGNFLGLMPQELRGTSKVLAVEYDSLTARIAKNLYPNASVLHSGIQSVPLPRNQFALAIGNPPFGNESLYFRYNPEVNRKTIHNQFFQASLDAVEEGGLVAMVVSHFLMDALDRSNRLELAKRADLVGAIRLPDTAFKENAGTEVVTDILFFRKRSGEEASVAQQVAVELAGGKAPKEPDALYTRIKAEIEAWTVAEATRDPSGSDAMINANQYFIRRPDMVIGKITAAGTMYGSDPALNVTLDDPAQFEPMLAKAIARLPSGRPRDDIAERTLEQFNLMADAMRLAVDRAEVGAVTRTDKGGLKVVVSVYGGGKPLMREIPLTADTPFNPEYSYTRDGKWERTQDRKGPDKKPLKVLDADGKPTRYNQKVTTTYATTADIPTRDKWGAERIEMMTDMLPIRELLKTQLSLETQDSPDRMLTANREKLNKAYDAFVKKHGLLHNAKSIAIATTMPDGALILSVEENVGTREDPKYTKAAIMSRRVTSPPKMAEKADSPSDAIALVLSERGVLDLDRLAELLGTDAAGAEKAISGGASPLAFFDPETNLWEPKDGYLSGQVRRKLNAARDARLEANVKALEGVMPEDWNAGQITPNIGSGWIPPDIYADFLMSLGYDHATVLYSEKTNSFSVMADGTAKVQWSTSVARARKTDDIVSRLLNSQSMRVTYRDQDDNLIFAEEATAETEAKAAEIFNEFLDWAYSDDDRRQRLVKVFNEKFNTRVLRQRDGSHLTLPGKVPDSMIKMRRHQMNAIWRGVTDPVVLYDHVVGAGKTFVAIARIMERRRMGLTRKALVVVPKHLTEQWGGDVAKLYPGAKILVAGEADFDRKNRRRLFAKIASADYDMVIIGHSSFGFIDLDQATEERFLMEELADAMAAAIEAEEAAAASGEGGWGKPFGVAEAERLIAKIEARLAKLRDGNRDRLLTFEEMGIDDLTIDEAHEFKNLSYSSRLTNVSGMGNKAGSNKAMDLHLKLRSLRERPGSSVAFLTGTPISNSASEMYLVLKNLAPKELKELGLDNFDAWRSMFVAYASAWEPTEAGGMKEVTRLGREWMNMKSLMDLYYSVTDAVTLQDLKEVFAEDNPGQKFPVPDVLSDRRNGDEREQITIAPTPEQRAILRDLVVGFEGLKDIRDPKERSAEMFRLMDRGRKVSLDARAINPRTRVQDGTGKIGAVVKNVTRIYREWEKDLGTQVIFLDRSVPTSKGDDKIVQAYDAARAAMQKAIEDQDEKAQGVAADKLEKFNASEVEALRDALAGGWNAYAEIKKQLVQQGIPADEIRFIQEAGTDEQKKALFSQVRSGKIRVLIGSTQRMGAGTNVQDRLVGLHHVDVTWKPSDIEQREGRIIRQGNLLLKKYGDDFAVEIIAYATEMTTDAKMWSLNAGKLKTINGIRKYDGSFMMEFEDTEAESMAEMAARATGNPLMVERVTLDGDIQKLEIQQRAYTKSQAAMRDELATAEKAVADAPATAAWYEAFDAELKKGIEDAREASNKRSTTVEGGTVRSRTSAKAAADAAIVRQRAGDEKARYSIEIGGEKHTTQANIDRAIAQAFGTEDFQATFKGKSYIDVGVLAVDVVAAFDAHISRGMTVDGITINGMPVEVDARHSSFRRNPTTEYAFSLKEEKSGRTMIPYWSDNEGHEVRVGMIRGGLDVLLNRTRLVDFKGTADEVRSHAATAGKRIPELREQVGKPWAKAADLDAKRERLAIVTAQLAGTSFSDALKDPDKAVAFSLKWTMTLDDTGEFIQPMLSAGQTPEQARALSGWESVESEPIAPTDPAVTQASIEAVQKIVGPKGRVQTIPRTMTAQAGMSTNAGADIGGFAMGGLMRVAEAPRAERFHWNLHHESIHVLRNLGLFSPGEWKTLEAAARRQGWVERFDVAKRYPNLPEDRQIEEAIAEAFASASRGDKDAPTGGVLGRAWQKTQRFLGAFRNALEGRGLRTAEGVFERTTAGRVGSRATARMAPRGPQDMAEQDRRAAELERALTLPTDEGDVSLMAGMSPELKRMLAEAAARTKRATDAAVSKLWSGTKVPDGVTVEQPLERRDISSLTAPFKTPTLVFQHTELAPVIAAGIRAEELQSRWITRLVHRYDQIRKTLDDAEGSFDKVTEALWAGDADQVDIADADARADLFNEFDLDDAEAEAFMSFHKLLEAQARLVDNHRRYMMPKVRAEKQRLIDALERILDHAKVPGSEAGRLYRRRATLTRRIARGKSKNPAVDSAAIQAINVQLRAMRAQDPDIQARISDMQDNIDALEARLNASGVRGRVKGYVPHKFYGSWRLWVLGEEDPETGEREKTEITSDQGFYNTREEAIDAAVAYKAENPDAEMLIAPKQIQWPVGIEGTTVSDAAFGRLARNLASKVELRGPALDEILTGVARRQNRRRMYGPGLHREGAEGYSREMDRVMRTHIGQTVRYVTMDKLKFQAITAMEKAGIGPYRIVTQERKTLQRAFASWLDDVMGRKQGFEETIDAALRRFPVPATVLMTGLAGTALASVTGIFGVAGAASPLISAAFGGYAGYQMYKTLTGKAVPWQPPEHYTDFPFRQFTSHMTTGMAHMLLGMVINIKSALVNLMQTAVNTYPEIGLKYTLRGMNRAAAATWAAMRGQSTSDTRLMERAGIQTLYRITEAGPVLAEHESKLAKFSMWAFQSAENINRAVAFFGGYARATDAGHTPRDAFEQATKVVRDTQFHMGNANKPEILRQQWARMPGQFKNFLFQLIARVFSIPAAKVAKTVAMMAVLGGALALPGFQVMNAGVKLLTNGWSPQGAIEQTVLEWQAVGGWTANTATVFARGLPALYTDISQSVGLGVGALPEAMSDLSGPWWSKVAAQQQAAAKNAGLVDRLAALSPGLNPLKALEAAANGMTIGSRGFIDALGDGKSAWTDWRRQGKLLYEPTNLQLLGAAFNFTPPGVTALRSGMRQTAQTIEEYRRDRAAYMADIIQAVRNKDYRRAGEIIAKANGEGHPITRKQVSDAVGTANMPAGWRMLEEAPKHLRPQIDQFRRGAENMMGGPPAR